MALPADNIITTTLQLIRMRLADNFFKGNPTIAYLLRAGRVKLESGGRRIDEPLIYAENTNTQSYYGYDRINVAPTEELTVAQYNWRQAATSISISGIEELQNAGAQQIFNLLRTKVEIADKSLQQFLDEKVHAARSTKNAAKDILGLDEIFDSDGTWSSLGGIDGGTYTWWRNKVGTAGDGSVGVGFSDAGTDADPVDVSADKKVLIRAMNRAMNEASKGSKDRIQLIITTQYLQEAIENHILETAGQLTVDQDMVNLGYDAIRYKGATIMWNENIRDATDNTKQRMYFINPDYMSLTVHRRRNFAMSKFVSPWDQDARVAQILWAGNMTCRNRRRLATVVFQV